MNFLLHVIAIIAMSAPEHSGVQPIFGRGKSFTLARSACPWWLPMSRLYRYEYRSYAWGLGAGLLAVLAVSAFFAWLSLRLDPDGFGVMSIAVHLGLLAVVLNWTSVTRGRAAFRAFPVSFLDSTGDFALLSVVICVLWALHCCGRSIMEPLAAS